MLKAPACQDRYTLFFQTSVDAFVMGARVKCSMISAPCRAAFSAALADLTNAWLPSLYLIR